MVNIYLIISCHSQREEQRGWLDFRAPDELTLRAKGKKRRLSRRIKVRAVRQKNLFFFLISVLTWICCDWLKHFISMEPTKQTIGRCLKIDGKDFLLHVYCVTLAKHLERQMLLILSSFDASFLWAQTEMSIRKLNGVSVSLSSFLFYCSDAISQIDKEDWLSSYIYIYIYIYVVKK